MKRTVRLTAVLLCLLMVCSVALVSCKGDGDESKGGAQSNTTSTSGQDELYKNLNEIIKWDRDLNILVQGEDYGTYYCQDFTYDEELDGDVVNDAILKRNDALKEIYGVTVVDIPAAQGQLEVMLRNDIDGGTKLYDVATPYMLSAANLAKQGLLYPLTKFDTIHFDQPWWDQSLVSQLSALDALFFATGDIGLLNKVCAYSIAFNKDMITDNGLESPYDLVKSHTWTLDKMSEMAKSVLSDDGDGVYQYDGNDVFGLSSAYGDALSFYVGTGNNLCVLNGEKIPEISIGSGNTVAIVQELVTMLNEDWVIHAQEMGDNMWDKSLAIFSEGRALFRTNAFSANKKLRDTDVVFGIVPLPLADEDQEEYYSYCSTNGTVSTVTIPSNCDDPEFSAYMLEAAAIEGKNYLTPAYVDNTLRYRDTRDDESQEMLDIIFSNVVYEVAQVNNFGLSTIISGLVQNNSTDVASALDTQRSAEQEAIDNCVAELAKWNY